MRGKHDAITQPAEVLFPVTLDPQLYMRWAKKALGTMHTPLEGLHGAGMHLDRVAERVTAELVSPRRMSSTAVHRLP